MPLLHRRGTQDRHARRAAGWPRPCAELRAGSWRS